MIEPIKAVMRIEFYEQNGICYLIFINQGKLCIENKNLKYTDDKFHWSYKRLSDNHFENNNDNYMTPDDAVIGAISHIMENN